ncbi:hypothetical protein BJH93_14415 [Kocuria polaris]|nr:hypothetical protein [Kocuria polaris]
MRGLAILGVVLFHLFGAGRISGGIDIFLAITGFLFTAMLLREATESGGKIRIGRYLARLARRLLLPVVIVVTFTVAAGLLLFPVTRHEQLWREARASLLYFENFELISSQLAYGAAGPDTSPFQHFWSLSVQGQFYLVWPLVAVLAVLLARALRKPAAVVMTILVAAVFAFSFAYALYMHTFSQAEAYLMTGTRAWELAFGGLLALFGARLLLPRSIRVAAGWVGFALIVTCGFVLDGAALFPGPWALWPLLGLALVLASTDPTAESIEHHASAARFLSNRVFSFIGNIAYSLYLWHWPLLILYLEYRGFPGVGLRGAALILTVSLVAAWLTYRFVEKPSADAAKWPLPAQLAAAATLFAIAAVITSMSISTLGRQIPEGYTMTGIDRSQHPGADAVAKNANVPDSVDFYPDPSTLAASVPMTRGQGCIQSYKDEPRFSDVLVCEDPREPENPRATIMLSGGSHAEHWYHGLKLLAERHNWELLVVNKDGCRFQTTENADRDACAAWNEGFLDVVEEREPDLVITSGSVLLSTGESEFVEDGALDRWQEIVDAGSDMLLIRGTARPGDDVPDCLASGGTPAECGPEYSYAQTNPLEELDLSEQMHTVDMTDYVCPDGACPAVLGNVAVYRDGSHLSNEYVETLAPYLDKEIRSVAPQLYR